MEETVSNEADPVAWSSFEDFFAAEADGQVRRAALLLGSVEDANDVVQEAFERLYGHWDTVADPGPYVNRIVLNICRDRKRRTKTQRQARTRFTPPPEAMSAPEVLSDALLQLPFNHRAAVVLRYWGGLTTAEIAEQLGCAPGSVGPWIDRGLRSLRKAMS